MRGTDRYDEAARQGRLWTPQVSSEARDLIVWLDAAQGVGFNSGTNRLTGWRDLSPRANNGTVSTDPPLFVPGGYNGRPSVNNDGVNFNLRRTIFAPSITTSTVQMYVAGTITSSTTNEGRIISATPGGGAHDWQNASGFGFMRAGTGSNIYVWRGGSASASLAITYDLPSVFGCHFTGSQRFVTANGTAGTAGSSSGAFGVTTIHIGASVTSGEGLNGHINEVIIDTGAYDLRKRQKTEGYLAWKWGIQGNLVASHPFKNRPPLIGD